MAEENPVGGSHRPRNRREKIQLGLIDLVGVAPVSRLHSPLERIIEIGVALGDPLIRPLSQFVISQQHVNLSGKLTLESRQNIDGLVRFVASRRIFKRTVDQLLKDYVAIRMRAEFGAFQQTAKIFDIAMKVSRNQNVRS